MNFGDISIDERVVLKLILNKHAERVENGYNFVGTVSQGRLLWILQGSSSFHKRLDIFSAAERLPPSPESDSVSNSQQYWNKQTTKIRPQWRSYVGDQHHSGVKNYMHMLQASKHTIMQR